VRVDVRTTLLEGGSRAVAGGGGHWFRRALVLTEVALSLMLAVGAGLLVRTLLHLEHLDPGFDGTNVLTASASLLDARYKDAGKINRLFRESLDAIRATPGVEAAAVGLHLPYQRWLNDGVKVRRPSLPDTSGGTSLNYVTPGYFETLRIPLRAGRVFDDRDNESSLPVALVNETFVRMFLKDTDPLAGLIVESKTTRRIVGVVSDLQQQPGLEVTGPITQEPAIYLPVSQFPAALFELVHTWYAPSWIVRASTSRQQLSQAISQSIARVDPLLPIAHFTSMVDERNSALQSQRTSAWLLGLLAALAVGLALVGVYGIVANSVVERTREFGIRMALGSSLGRVVWDAISPGIALALVGVLTGGLLAAAGVTALKGLLYGVEPLDPLTFLSTAALVIAVSAAASLLPAIVLTRLEPSSVLRQD
jgi:predicted permease